MENIKKKNTSKKSFWTKIKDEVIQTKELWRSVPSIVFALFAVSVIAMNLLANKTIVSLTMENDQQWLGIDGGIIVSWLAFLTMDIVTKYFGPKSSTRLSILATLINLLCCLIFLAIAKIPGIWGAAGESGIANNAINDTFGGTWFILLDSTIAFIVSAIVNNFLNSGVNKLFKNNPNGKFAYFTSSYVSTFIAQFIDNFIFATLTFMVFAPIFWDGYSWTILACSMSALTGAVVELLCEIVFSPFGYRIVKRWKREEVGQNYLEKYGCN